MRLFQEGYKLCYRQMVTQLPCNKDMRMFHNFFHYFVHLLYRVSIKSFPDYKHLSQENYVGHLS